MKLLFFNRSFYPDFEATGQFLTELCEDLSQEGNEITVISGRSYYSSSKSKFFFLQCDKYKSINIVRAYGTIFPKSFFLFRLINLSTYFLLAFIAGFLVKPKPEIVIAQTDPPLLGLLGIFFSKWYKASFIYYCKDIYPDVGIIIGKIKNPFLVFLLEKVNLLSYRKANKIITIGENMKRNIMSKGVSKSKIEVVNDWTDTTIFKPIAKRGNKFIDQYKLEDKFIVMHSGNIGLTQNLDKVVDVASHLKNVNELLFLFVGEGANKTNLQKLVLRYNLSNCLFLPYQSKDDLNYSLNAADIHLITHAKGLSSVMVPSKVYNILACGKPFIAWVDKDSEIDSIASRFNCGITIPSDDIKGMVKVIEWALNNKQKLEEMGKNGRCAAIEYFDRCVSVNKFHMILQGVKVFS